MAQKLKPIFDPVAHATAETGYPCSVAERVCPWEGAAAYHTTGQFARTGERDYHQHCGPTAVTNAVCAARKRRGMAPMDPAEVFALAAAVGRRRLTYWNIPEKLHLGGTSYLLLGPYVAACLRKCGLDGVRQTWRIQARPEQMAAELARGRMLVLAMTHHRCYGSHLVVAYGLVRVAVAGRSKPRLYLLVADGWAGGPRYIDAETLRLCGYVAVQV